MQDDYQVFSAVPVSVRENWIAQLKTAYSKPHRHYHTITHIQSMLNQLASITVDIEFTSEQLQILKLAIWFHDVVYDIPAEVGYNESFSALLLKKYGQQIDLVLAF